MREQEYVTIRSRLDLRKLFWGLMALLVPSIFMITVTLATGEEVAGVLLFFGALYGALAIWVSWRRGVTLDRLRRTVRVWSGPSFPLLWKTWPPGTFHTVSVSLERVENHLAERRSLIDFEPRYSTHYPVRLQQDLDRENWDPYEPQPPVCTVENFASHAEALAFAQDVAQLLGLDLRDDYGPAEREATSLTPPSPRGRGE
jgi:hypothetical protein